ncbi:FlgK family flagellar hook-associated protein, partial [Polymorphobacter multimanifer]|uniref:FlgK family flagellar hook-associated protein n=1 Tax=Polymorphobacter multimanifer TaxID=1070431 RepID=UPI001666F8B3
RAETALTGAGVEARLAGVHAAAADLAAGPTSIAARALFLDSVGQAASAFRTLGDTLAALATDIETATANTATQINAITSSLEATNAELRRTPPGGAASLGLLDARDTLLADLASRVRISVSEEPTGAVTIRLGSGAAAPLLLPAFGTAVRVAAQDGPSGAELVLDPTHRAEAVRLPLSGSLAGLLEASRSVAALRADIDSLATRFADDLNNWHTQGTDLAGNPGLPLLATDSLDLTPGRANAGTAAIDFTLAEGAAPVSYTLIADAGTFTLSRTDGSATITGAGALTLDGLTVRPGEGARSGDVWTLAPLTGARALAPRTLAPEPVAVASRFQSDASPLNTGQGRLAMTLDPAAAAFAAPLPLDATITAAGTLDLTDATGTIIATLAFTPGTPIEGNGFSFTLSGTPAVGDRFRLLATGPGSADNGNIRALEAVRSRLGPGGTLEAAFDAGTAGLGTRLADTKRLAAAALAVRDDTARAADAVSGVDLDREAAELTRLQMAYRANAQVIAAAR